MDLSRTGALRRAISYVAIAATVPYLTLKLLWISGSTVGIIDPSKADDTVLRVLNSVTFGMDAAALLLALAFVRRWGRRMPAGLLAFPMWIATGLLGTILVALPVDLLLTAVLGAEKPTDQPQWLSSWVYTLVYGGFTVQGITLISGFALYAGERWAGLLADRIGELPRTATLRFQQVLACVAALIAVPVAAGQFYWAAGGRTGLPLAMVREVHRPMQVMAAVAGAMLMTGCSSILVVVFRRCPGRPLRPVLLTAWVASGCAFAWGAWTLFAGGMGTRVPDLDHAVPGITPLIYSAQVISGLLLLVVGTLTLVERASPRADVESLG